MTTRGERLRKARERKYPSARQAALAMGVPVATYSSHEHAQQDGGRNYNADIARRYARHFGVEVDYLLFGTQPTTNGAPAMTSNDKTRIITLTGRPPVKIKDADWPVIAHGRYAKHDGQVEQQANRKWEINIRVRAHADGRAIVYGTYSYNTCFQHEESEAHKVGVLLAVASMSGGIGAVADEMIERVRDADMHAHIRAAADECISELPPEEL